ncbi:MAG: GYDIA family GHMP kinase [Bacteroidota bacterium]
MNVPLSFHAWGKILMTGEYLVLKGADALAVPLVKGQGIEIKKGSSTGLLSWKALDTEGEWFAAAFNLPSLEIVTSSDVMMAQRLKAVLSGARSFNAGFLTDRAGLSVTTRLDFNRHWGFGSSSTLTSLVARWAGVDPMKLHSLISKGSGYDVACSVAETPVLYSLKDGIPDISPVDFYPPFTDSMFLVYLGSKQNSDIEVETFGKYSNSDFKDEIRRISEISVKISGVVELEYFIDLLVEHESIMSSVLNKKPVKERLFPDFKGVVKSLGAWGGDFALAVSCSGKSYITDYFKRKSFDLVLPYRSLVFAFPEKDIVTS